MARWVERTRPLSAVEREQLELCRTVGRELLTGDPPWMVPLLLLFGDDHLHPAQAIALPEVSKVREHVRSRLEEHVPHTWALLQAGAHGGQRGLLVDLGNRQTVFALLVVGENEPVLVDQFVSPMRTAPTDAELDAIDDIVARATELPPGTVLAVEDATGREARFEPWADTRSLEHLMDQLQDILLERATHFRLCGVGPHGPVLATVTAANRTCRFSVRDGQKVLLNAPSLGDD